MAIREKLMSLWVQFLDGFLPKRFKRMIFLGSLLAYIQGTTRPDKELICKLNQLLHLASSSNPVMFTPRFSRQIWPQIVPRNEPLGNTGVVLAELTEVQDYKIFKAQARSASDRIIRKTPQWLKYGSHKQMRADLMKLLEGVGKMTAV